MTHKIIKTENYLLVVDDSEIRVGDILFDNDMKIVLLWQKYFPSHQLISKQKIIAHLPLNKAPILEGVDLLPPIDDDVEHMAQAYFEAKGHNLYNHYNTMPSFKEGYNKAREKYKYTEEDMRKAFNAGLMNRYSRIGEAVAESEFIQSLSQYPTEFECEMEVVGITDDGINTIVESKTITNAQGQRVWVGKYL